MRIFIMSIFVLFHVLFGLSTFSTREILGKSLEFPQSYKKEDLDRFESGFEWGTDPEEGPYFQGDIIRAPQLGNGVRDKNKLWPFGIVYYKINGTFDSTETNCIREAIKHIENRTCIRFLKKRVMDRDYVSIQKPDGGCSSNVGKVGGEQSLRLSASCFATSSDRACYGSAVHEIFHALGMMHEHTRSDRDDFVLIKYENIQNGTDENGKYDSGADRRPDFQKVSSDEYSNYGEDYDIGSVMHYHDKAFIKDELFNTEVTIAAIRDTKGKVMGQRRGLSDLDIRKMSNMYSEECKRRRFPPFNFKGLS